MASGQARDSSIKIDRLAVIRGNRLVLQNISLDARAGDIIWLRGANGTGKSTLLRAIAGLLPHAGGTMKVTGSLTLADDRLALDTNLTTEKALQFWTALDATSADMLYKAINQFDLSGLTDIPVSYLSSGQRKRAALARVAASGADIWLLDEPYNGLDNANALRLDKALMKHGENGGIAVVAAHQPAAINVAQTLSLDDTGEEQAA